MAQGTKPLELQGGQVGSEKHTNPPKIFFQFQSIIMYEYLPSLLGEDSQLSPYTGYKPDIHPGISISFQSAAFRWDISQYFYKTT